MMEMLIKSVFTLLIVVVPYTFSGKIACHMVSFDNEDALSGYCCVFVKNNSELQQRKAEIKQHLLENLKNETKDELSSSIEVTEVSEVTFSEDEESSEKAPSTSRPLHDKIKFPGGFNFEERKNVTTKHYKHTVSVVNKNGTIIQNNLNQSEITPTNENTSNNTTPTVITLNRNAVDTPETCPDGNEKDHNGDCVPVF